MRRSPSLTRPPAPARSIHPILTPAVTPAHWRISALFPALILALFPVLILALIPALALAAALLAPVEAAAQEREIDEAGLPRATADRLIAIANDPATLHLPGESHIPADSVLRGNVVVMGPLRLGGWVDGELIVIHGDLEMETGARVGGDLTVVDGEVRGAESAEIGGTLIAYRRESRFVQRGERGRHITHRRAAHPPGRDLRASPGSSFRLAVRADGYNRVEGLPVRVGPVLDTGGRSPFRAETQLIWRTEGRAPFAHDRIGYRASGEQFLGGHRQLRFGAGVHSTIDPIEGRGLSDRENAWATFALTRDHRDYVEVRGWRAFVRATPRALPVDASVELRDETHGIVGDGDPWTLLYGGRAWRPQPLVAEGSLRTVTASLQVDTRDDHEDPMDGWLVRGEWRQGVDGTLALPAAAAGTGDPGLDPRFSSALVDVRRHHPIGRAGSLGLRGAVGGAPGADDVLPPQYQHALGGSGTLPGHAAFSADCGARDAQVEFDREDLARPMFPAYGCDRFALLQAEYRGPLNLHVGFGSGGEGRSEGHPGRPGRPSWAVFFNAGRGWAGRGGGDGFARSDSRTLYDAGLGLLFGTGGIYWAVPLGEDVRGSTFTLRLDRRF